jgi:hypothetical protein
MHLVARLGEGVVDDLEDGLLVIDDQDLVQLRAPSPSDALKERYPRGGEGPLTQT